MTHLPQLTNSRLTTTLNKRKSVLLSHTLPTSLTTPTSSSTPDTLTIRGVDTRVGVVIARPLRRTHKALTRDAVLGLGPIKMRVSHQGVPFRMVADSKECSRKGEALSTTGLNVPRKGRLRNGQDRQDLYQQLKRTTRAQNRARPQTAPHSRSLCENAHASHASAAPLATPPGAPSNCQ